MYNNFNYYENPYTYGDYYDDDFAEDFFDEDEFTEEDAFDGEYYGEYVPTLCETCVSAPVANPADQTADQAPNQGDFENAPGSPITHDINYTQGYLETLIGRRIKVEFILGTNMLIDREGTLLKVGISYIVIKEVDTNNEVMCDIYSIKFVNIFPVGSTAQ